MGAVHRETSTIMKVFAVLLLAALAYAAPRDGAHGPNPEAYAAPRDGAHGPNPEAYAAPEANAAANATAVYCCYYGRPYGYRKRDAEQVATAPKVYDGSNYDQPDPTGPYYGHRYGYRKRDAERVATAPKVYDGSNYDQPDPTGPYYGIPYGYRK